MTQIPQITQQVRIDSSITGVWCSIILLCDGWPLDTLRFEIEEA